jgi:hypothetical protein
VKAQVANYFKVGSLKTTILKTVVPLKEVQIQLKLSKFRPKQTPRYGDVILQNR